MKPNPESAPESSANAFSPADVNATPTSDLREMRQKYDEAQRLVADLEARLQVNMTVLASATAQVQREQSERRRQEQRITNLTKSLEDLHEDLKLHLKAEDAAREKSVALEQQLVQRGEVEAQLRADLEREVTEWMASRAELDSLKGINKALRDEIQNLESSTGEFGATQQDLEKRLQADAAALAEANDTAKRAIEERANMETLLNKAREEAKAEARSSSVELARLRAALQSETLHRHRLESEALQERGKVGEAERAGTSVLGRFQQRLRNPVFSLVQSIGRLLDEELTPQQREIAEAVLANAAMVQTSLQDLGNGVNARRGNSEKAPQNDAGRPTPVDDKVKQF